MINYFLTAIMAMAINSSDTQQLIIVKTDKGAIAQLESFERGSDNNWVRVHSFPAVIGLNGFAENGSKREGDKKTPSGLFDFGTAWGYADQNHTKMPYRIATDKDKYIDDIESDEYNQWVHGDTDAKSYENMKRSDGLYELGLVIDYNSNPVVKGMGSAIFLHIWRSSRQGTAGCVAIAKPAMESIFAWLDPEKRPKILLNP
jgi:L,D-peptidoglycan transpeptidase YkuD (ErfK/YbiS/YcfS/YnhG family)